MKYWLSKFPREDFFFDFFNNISRDPNTLIADISEFLGNSTDIDWGDYPFNAVLNVRIQTSQEIMKKKLEDLYWKEIEHYYEQFGEKVACWRC
jgi:hypothetical protein